MSRIIFFDTETTGILSRYPEAEIIEYTFQVWEDGVRGDFVTKKVKPGLPVPEEAARINGYTEEAWAGAQPWGVEDWENVRRFFPSCEANVKPKGIVVPGGHNVDFDIDMLNNQIRRFHGLHLPLDLSYRKVDTCRMAIALFELGEITSASLVNVARYFGIDTSLAHSSAGDVEMTIQVWEQFLLVLDSGLRSMRGVV